MSMNDTISDLLTRIRNGQMSNKKSISAPYSKMKESICKVMLDEGYIDGNSSHEGKNRTLLVELKKYEGKIKVVDLGTNKGMCYALNTGMWYVTKEWFLIVNDDNVFPLEWDKKLMDDVEFGKNFKYGEKLTLR